MVAGDGQQAGNFDCMVEFFQMRGMSAKALKLAPSGNALPASLANALEIRTRLLKVLRDVYGDTANKYFASGNKWTFVPTEPNGMCGLRLVASSMALITHATRSNLPMYSPRS